MSTRTKVLCASLLGISLLILGPPTNVAMAQTTTALTYESTSLDSFARKPKPKPKPVSVPEPASMILLGTALVGLGIVKRVSRKD